jgi:NTP pyrophosphatase (non-canonical NTP hydrolase)
MSPEDICEEVASEVRRATTRHPPFNSAHEGYSVILEELDELWDEVKKRQKNVATMREEAIQVAAMAVRFVLDLG